MIEAGNSQLKLALEPANVGNTLLTGRFTFASIPCSGSLIQQGITNNNQIIFREKLESGNCKRNCIIVVEPDLVNYKVDPYVKTIPILI